MYLIFMLLCAKGFIIYYNILLDLYATLCKRIFIVGLQINIFCKTKGFVYGSTTFEL